MRKSLMIIIAFIATLQSSCSQSNNAFDCPKCTTSDSIINRKLMGIDFDKYLNGEVGAFLSDVKRKYADFITITKKPGYIDRVMFSYSDSITLEVRVSNLNQKKRLNFGYTFNIDEFKKKKLSMICFRYGGRCIKGCKDEFCYDQ